MGMVVVGVVGVAVVDVVGVIVVVGVMGVVVGGCSDSSGGSSLSEKCP